MSQFVTYTMKVGWEGQKPAGTFLIGSSTFAPSGTHTFGWEFGSSFTGANDDVSSGKWGCLNATITRGRESFRAGVPAGRMNAVFNDPDGRYNVRNTSSPLFGKIRPYRAVMVQGTVNSVTYDLFRGWLYEQQAAPDFGQKDATFVFQDLFLRLQRAKTSIVIAPLAPTPVGEIIGMILDKVELQDPALRNLGTGITIYNFSADGTKNALQLIADLLTVDLGIFYVSRSGVLTYKDRNYLYEPSVATYSSTQFATPGISLESVKNKYTITRDIPSEDPNAPEAVQMVAIDQASIDEFGPAEGEAISTPYLPNDSEAQTLIENLVGLSKDPRVSIWSMDMTEVDQATIASVLQRDIGEKITITAPGATGTYIVEKVLHKIQGGTFHSTTWVLSEFPAALVNALKLGTGQFDTGTIGI